MKKYLVTLLPAITAACFLAAPAHLSADKSKLDSSALVLFDDYISNPMSRATAVEMNALVSFDACPDTAAMSADGYRVLSLFPGDGEWFAVVTMPVSDLDTFTDREDVTNLSMGLEARPTLNNARRLSKIDEIHQGKLGMADPTLNIPYTGAGVVAGVVDMGIDPKHINFCNADGSTRISRYWRLLSGGFTEYKTPDKIIAAPTDNSSATHGTHVAGILGGSYSGKGTFGWYDTGSSSANKAKYGADVANPFVGVAPEAELLLAGGSTSTPNIVAAVERIIKYGEENNRPVVVNLSLGLNNGPHDGTGVTERAIEALGKRAVICVSSGNEAANRQTVAHTFGEDGTPLLTLFNPTGTEAFSGSIEIWLEDLEMPEFELIIVDSKTGEQIYNIAASNKDDEWSGFASSTYTNAYFKHPEAFVNNFSGSVRVLTRPGDTSPDRRLYMVNIASLLSKKDNGGQYYVGVSIKGTPGKRVWIYSFENCPLTAAGIKGYTEGDGEASINTLCTARNTVSVGSYNSCRNMVTINQENYYNPELTVNDISNFSSYGELIDGRKLPHICAPGAIIISSMSRDYAAKSSDLVMGVVTDSKNKKNYWTRMQGTSMSSPFMAGTVALWLEADPTLTVDDVIDIATVTATRDARVKTAKRPVQWGAGKLNALAGLVEVINRRVNTGIADVSADGNDILITPQDGGWQVCAPGCNVSVTISDTTGNIRTVMHGDSTVAVETGNLSTGIYLITAEANGRRITRKIAVRH